MTTHEIPGSSSGARRTARAAPGRRSTSRRRRPRSRPPARSRARDAASCGGLGRDGGSLCAFRQPALQLDRARIGVGSPSSTPRRKGVHCGQDSLRRRRDRGARRRARGGSGTGGGPSGSGRRRRRRAHRPTRDRRGRGPDAARRRRADGQITRIEPRRHGAAVRDDLRGVSVRSGRGRSRSRSPTRARTTSGRPWRETRRPAAAGVVRLDRKGRVTLSVDIAAYQATDPDPDDQDDFPEESNPFGLAVLHGRRRPRRRLGEQRRPQDHQKKKIKTVARFLREDVPWPDVELPLPGPAAGHADARRVRPDGGRHRPGRRLVRLGAEGLPVRQGNVPDLADRARGRRTRPAIPSTRTPARARRTRPGSRP